MSPLLIAIIFIIIVYKLLEYYKNPPNIPPCMPRFPFVGSYLHLLWGNYNFPHKSVERYVKKLKSKIISCYFGPFFTVIVNDYPSIKEVLSREEFDGRLSDAYVLKARGFGKKLGIFFVDGFHWKEQRRYALRQMRDFGFGRRQDLYENQNAEEIALLVNILKNGPINDEEKTVVKSGQALFPDVLYPYSANSIWMILFGDKFSRSEHHKLRYLCRCAMVFQRSGDTSGGVIVQRPFLRHFGNLFGYKNFIESHYKIVDFVKEYLEEYRRTHNDDTDRGMTDRYLKELENLRNEKSTFSEEQLLIALVDIMFPALSALPSMLTHCIKYVMHNPEVYKKVQQEIDTVVGTGRLVTWEDRAMLPYTEATVRETLRSETLTPFSVIHRATKNTTLCGYNIPVNTAIITNLAGLNNDTELWGDPKNFRPERFMDGEGKLGKDYTFPFGFGRRVCAGETFARYHLFGVFAALMQNFNFSFVDGEPTKLTDKLPGIIVTPKETWIRVEQRC